MFQYNLQKITQPEKSNPLFWYQLHPWWATSVLCDRNHAIAHWTQPVKYRVICKYFPFCFNCELPIKHLPYGPNVMPNYFSVENFVILIDARRGVISRAILSIILNNVIKKSNLELNCQTNLEVIIGNFVGIPVPADWPCTLKTTSCPMFVRELYLTYSHMW